MPAVARFGLVLFDGFFRTETRLCREGAAAWRGEVENENCSFEDPTKNRRSKIRKEHAGVLGV